MGFISNIFKVENITSSNHRLYFANKYAYTISGLIHLFFILIFYYLNLPILSFYNIISVLVFLIAYILNNRGYQTYSSVPVILEIMLHAYLTVYFIGWDSGFFYYLLALIPLVSYNSNIPSTARIIFSLFIVAFYISLKIYANTHIPLVILDIDIINNLYNMNSAFLILGITALVYYFNLASDITENIIGQERNNADQANQAKSRFLANMSHELRTPLNAIIGYGEMLKEDAIEQKRHQDALDLSKITNAGHHLLSLIDSILDLTKVESGKMTLEYQNIDISPLINDIASTVKPLISKKHNTLIIHCENDFGHACIDQIKVKQILFNLISNACKFTNNGNITLSVYKENNKHQDICFKIEDTGIGIAKEKIDALFQPFVQADISTTRLYGGTGLGLTIIKHFITLMDGTTHVESILGKGTTFIIKLPINTGNCKN